MLNHWVEKSVPAFCDLQYRSFFSPDFPLIESRQGVASISAESFNVSRCIFNVRADILVVLIGH